MDPVELDPTPNQGVASHFSLPLGVRLQHLHKCNRAVRPLTFTQLIMLPAPLLMDKNETSSANSIGSLQLIKCQNPVKTV